MNQVFFSVIIPTYNRADFLVRSIQSVIDQTFSNWELIIVDDGSTDNSRQVVQSFNDERIIYIWQENGEKCIARNNGIKAARGLYICFLDTDDYFLADHLNNFYEVIVQKNYPEAMLISGLYIEDGDVQRKHPLYHHCQHPLRFVWQNFIVPSASCHHRSILQKFQFNEKYYVWEDRHLWLRILTEYPLIQVDRFSVVLFEHKGRSTKKFYSRISLNSVKAYFACIQDVFNNYGELLHMEISKKEKKYFIAKRAQTYLEIAVKNSQWKESAWLSWVLLMNRPAFICSFLFLKLSLLLPFNSVKQLWQAEVEAV
jgi:glycosyltransferase involved in cell wall biosynthesis